MIQCQEDYKNKTPDLLIFALYPIGPVDTADLLFQVQQGPPLNLIAVVDGVMALFAGLKDGTFRRADKEGVIGGQKQTVTLFYQVPYRVLLPQIGYGYGMIQMTVPVTGLEHHLGEAFAGTDNPQRGL
jgi:hypothetical protein